MRTTRARGASSRDAAVIAAVMMSDGRGRLGTTPRPLQPDRRRAAPADALQWNRNSRYERLNIAVDGDRARPAGWLRVPPPEEESGQRPAAACGGRSARRPPADDRPVKAAIYTEPGRAADSRPAVKRSRAAAGPPPPPEWSEKRCTRTHKRLLAPTRDL